MREFFVPETMRVDAYQATHFELIPPGMENLQCSQGIFRKPLIATDHRLVSAGLRPFIELNMTEPITMENIEEADYFYNTFGVGKPYPWPKTMFETVVKEHDGFMPITIIGMPDGEAHYVGEPHVQVYTTTPGMGELVGWIESTILPYLWPSSIVATRGRIRKQKMMELFKKVYPSKSDEEIRTIVEYQFHDFGRRGGAASQITGIAHLMNFLGTDTVDAAFVAQMILNNREPFGACSVVASAHRTVTPWATEIDAYKNAIQKFGDEIISIVADSYDQTTGFRLLAGFADEIKQRKGKLVGRVDSGDVVEAVIEGLQIFDEKFHSEKNETGLKVLNHSAVLQGDGIDDNDIFDRIYPAVIEAGFCPTNVILGMGENNHKAVRSETEHGYKTCLVGTEDGGVRRSMKDSNSRFKRSLPCPVQYDSSSSEYRINPVNIEDLDNICQKDGYHVFYKNGQIDNLETFVETRERTYNSWNNLSPNVDQNNKGSINPKIREMQKEYLERMIK